MNDGKEFVKKATELALERGAAIDLTPPRLLLYRNLYQWWGNRVEFEETRRGDIEILVRSSSLREIGSKVIPRSVFDRECPQENNQAVEWACKKIGIDPRSGERVEAASD